jgi:chromosome segregation ATPase
MNEELKLVALETEGFKRVHAVTCAFNENGLTVIGGGNGEGKTSFLDSAIWALGGDRYKPSSFLNDEAEKVSIRLELSNGLIVERKGVNGALKVSGGNGKQSLLDGLLGELTLDLPAFMAATDTKKAAMLLKAFPQLAAQLQKIDQAIKELYQARTVTGAMRDQKKKYAAELPYNEDAPDAPLSGADMAKKLQESLSLNARNNEIRRRAKEASGEIDRKEAAIGVAQERVTDLEKRLKQAQESLDAAQAAFVSAKAQYAEAMTKTESLKDADTKELEGEMERIDIINNAVRDNINKRTAEEAAEKLARDYAAQSAEIEEKRQARLDLLATVDMPMEGLSIDEEGALIFNGRKWDCMSTSEQYRVATALAASLKPSCKFVLLDRIEAMDKKTLAEFDAWLTVRGLQGICTRVSDGKECHIIIEDGYVAATNAAAPKKVYQL